MITANLNAQITLPEWLVILRRRAGITQGVAAERSGVNHRHLMKLEVGELTCRIEDISLLAALYKVSPATFFGLDATAPQTPENGHSQLRETS